MEQVNREDWQFPRHKPTLPTPAEIEEPKQAPKQTPEPEPNHNETPQDEPEPRVSEEKRRNYLPGGTIDIANREKPSDAQPSNPSDVQKDKYES